MKHGFYKIIAIIGMLFLAGCNLTTYEEEHVHSLDATGIDTFVIDQEEGEVSIVGIDDATEINVITKSVVRGEDAELTQQFGEENLSFTLTSDGNVATLISKIDHDLHEEDGDLNLVIEVPSHIELEYRQSEGPLVIRDMKADMQLQHGTKSTLIENVEGNIQITDGSGKLTMNQVKGDITINKNASALNVAESEGELTIIAGSGAINVENQIGNVSIRSGTGDVSVEGVDGDVIVLANRSGELKLEGITGEVNDQSIE